MTDLASVVAQIEKGDKLQADPTHTTWTSDVIVIEAGATSEWRVPFDDDWYLREFVIEGPGGQGVYYRVDHDADGVANLYRMREDAPDERYGKLTSLDRVGEVSMQKRLSLASPDELGLSPLGERRAGGEV